jgi:hypothetical protein
MNESSATCKPSFHLGSTTVTLNFDGTKASELRYYPWGGIRYTTTNATPTAHQYTSQVNDSDINPDLAYPKDTIIPRNSPMRNTCFESLIMLD